MLDYVDGMILYFVVCAVSLVWWYRGAMRKIEIRHDAEMKRITDKYNERMVQIQAEYEAASERAAERYKKAVLKYDLWRNIKE
jgi:hypothetical protein